MHLALAYKGIASAPLFTKLFLLFDFLSYRQVLVGLCLGDHLVPPVLRPLEQLVLLLLLQVSPDPPGPQVPGVRVSVSVLVLVRLGMSVAPQSYPRPISVPHSLYQT